MNPHDQLDWLWHRDTSSFDRAAAAIARACVEGDRDALVAAQGKLAGVIGRTRALSAFIAADNGLREIDKAMAATRARSRHDRFVDVPLDASRAPTFWAAIRAILRRRPMLARSADAVIDAHAAAGIAFARSAAINITKRVQELLADAVELGFDRPKTVDIMRRMTGWNRAYSETVYRTNLSSAYAEGQHYMASLPEVSDDVAGFIWSAVGDRDTRPNHAAADGVIGGIDDPFWEYMGPPAGYNCRCSRIVLTWPEARRRGIREIPPVKRPHGAMPDVGFRR